MTYLEFEALRAFMERGYAVVIWTPDELRGVDPELIEQLMIERAADAIEALCDDTND